MRDQHQATLEAIRLGYFNINPMDNARYFGAWVYVASDAESDTFRHKTSGAFIKVRHP